MLEKSKKPFIPKDKPKSWVIGILAGLIGMAVGLVAFLFSWLELRLLVYVCAFIFLCCWVVGAINIILFNFKLFTGKYRDLKSEDWENQVW